MDTCWVSFWELDSLLGELVVLREALLAAKRATMVTSGLAAMVGMQAGLTAAEMCRVKASLRVNVMSIALTTLALPKLVATKSPKKV